MSSKPYIILENAPKRADDIGAFLNKVISEIKTKILLSSLQENKLRFVIIELCTNCIKHTKGNNCVFEIGVSEDNIQISKKVFDHCFKPNLLEKIGQLEIGKVAEIYFSETNNHFIEILRENKFRFLDPKKMGYTTDQLKDHFGLHIITICSDDFIYEFDEIEKIEAFRVYMKI
ncbi:hypothetical protein Pedsa_1373 [Pseudopedobacter saltans DSM 12145]|uniref:Histidine kinase/HSP90-like ATPase domain-containing protein n=1 Tax=Pseudopedobacter saltans (strain ATCC 51119 / DSM 12145 / JCM 21818 / CCUG 39354 / LMG 10337 / NBRC 100064 / NCIMB 13643) TaxID=762903 RepID=F0SEP9_PSESL|nr:sensor histidine kinase [Pseudopedobacter saltans]ADY51939.1 hypothetical protein Pedsa_1373 [Pseudopedobacter saltans DSM 12145]